MTNVLSIKKRSTHEDAPDGFGGGSVVELASGGPKMTVRETIKSSTSRAMVRLDWFNDVGDACTGDYYIDQLVTVSIVKYDIQAGPA